MNITAQTYATLGIGVLTVGLLTAGATAIKAADSTRGTQFAQRFADRFSLNVEDVQAKREEHLVQLVDDGSITADQKDALVAKHEEMNTSKEAVRAIADPTEKREAIKAQHEEMQSFLESIGVDSSLLGGPSEEKGPGMMGRGEGGRRGAGMHGRMGRFGEEVSN